MAFFSTFLFAFPRTFSEEEEFWIKNEYKFSS